MGKCCFLMINKNYIYFNAAMRDRIGERIEGMDFFKADSEGNTILSCKPGKQFPFNKKKTEYRIVCRELADYILSVYGPVRHYKLVFDDGYYILMPDVIS